MEIYIYNEKIKGFLIDSNGEIKAPMNFETSNEIGKTAKEIFKELVKYCLTTETLAIDARKCSEIITGKFELSKNTMLAIVELKQNEYIDII